MTGPEQLAGRYLEFGMRGLCLNAYSIASLEPPGSGRVLFQTLFPKKLPKSSSRESFVERSNP